MNITSQKRCSAEQLNSMLPLATTMDKPSSATASYVHDSSCNDTLIKILITLVNDIKECVQGRLNEVLQKLEKQEKYQQEMMETIQHLKTEVEDQQRQLKAMKQQENNTVNTVSGTATTTNLPVKQRGMRSHNLILTCQKIEIDPKIYAENLFLEKFNRKPNIIAVQELKKNGKSDLNQTKNEESQTKLLVTFHSVWEARQIYKDRIMALKNTGIYVQEDLTKDESYLFFKARQLKKNKQILQTWTENGDIYYKERFDSTPQILNDQNPLLKNIEQSSYEIQDLKKHTNEEQIKPQTRQEKEDEEPNPIHPAIGNTVITTNESESSSNESLNTYTMKDYDTKPPQKNRKSQRNKKKRNASE